MEGMVKPDIVIYLRAEDTSNRKDFGAERYETAEIHEQVIRNFDELFENEKEITDSSNNYFKLVKINSNKSIEEVTNDIWDDIKDSL